jgi:ParB family chromosome partitioning protein
MKRRNTLADLLRQDPEKEAPFAPDMPEPVASGALRAMGFSLERMSAEAESARDLKAQIAAGEYVVEIDPALVNGSFVSDRLPVEHDVEFDAFVKSIEQQGQQVPILVRPHPDQPGRYQVAYGHRRLKAASILGRKVRAIVRQLTDVELVIAQAKENLDRRDLSYIERALFAWHLEERKFERSTIMEALGVEKGDMSRLLTVASSVPLDILRAIGPAPKVGRPRWVQLAEMLKAPRALTRATAAIAEPLFGRSDTNARFRLIMQALAAVPQKEAAKPKPVTGASGQVLARLEERSHRMHLCLDNPEFRSFVLSRLPTLVEEFEQDAS